MNSESPVPDRPAVMATHNVGVCLPKNTKYESGNLISRLLMRGFMRALVDLVLEVGPGTILDVGCGEGLVVRQLQTLGHRVQISGMDMDVELLGVAQQLAPGAGYLLGDAYQLPLSSHSYDLVICTEVLEHMEAPKAALAEMVRLAKGHCLLSVPHEPWWRAANMIRGSYLADWGNTPGHVNHWDRKSFIELIGEHLDVLAIRQPFPWTMVLGRVP